jgi:pimeloyl-ACP methyl ester carboxylesterase
LLLQHGARVIVPYLRGFGGTTFLLQDTPRSGQQAAMGADLCELLDALGIERAIVAGFDWGATAACVASALWPERVAGMVSVCGYKIQDIARAGEPQAPEMEHRLWYQHYFQHARGQAGLTRNRKDYCRLLWRLWSPSWSFDEATFERSAKSFDNPDFVAVVISSYRHRFGLVAGDPALEHLEQRLALGPPITVPAVTLDGEDDGVMPIGGTASHKKHFTGRHEHRVVKGAGHNLPQENPAAFADAILTLRRQQRD